MLLVAGYALSWAFFWRDVWPRLWEFGADIWWPEGWRIGLRLVALGPTLACPFLLWDHRGDRPTGRWPSGASTLAAIGGMKLIHLLVIQLLPFPDRTGI